MEQLQKEAFLDKLEEYINDNHELDEKAMENNIASYIKQNINDITPNQEWAMRKSACEAYYTALKTIQEAIKYALSE